MSSNQNIVRTFIAAGAITEFAIVSVNSDGKVVVTTAGTDVAAVGVAQRACSTGDPVDVVISGLTRVICAASNITAFEATPRLAAAAAGTAAVAAVGDYPDMFVQMNINQTAASSGDQITVLWSFAGAVL
jgi:hypothetical protein